LEEDVQIVKIYNDGVLPKKLKKQDFGKKSIPRNPLIAQLMFRAGYIEKMGTGIKKMKALVKKAGLKPIKFDFTNFTTVTFYKPSYGSDMVSGLLKEQFKISMNLKQGNLFIDLKLNTHRLIRISQILQAIKEGTFSTVGFSKTENIKPRTVERDILLLKNEKWIAFKGHSKSGKYQITEKYKKLKKSIK